MPVRRFRLRARCSIKSLPYITARKVHSSSDAASDYGESGNDVTCEKFLPCNNGTQHSSTNMKRSRCVVKVASRANPIVIESSKNDHLCRPTIASTSDAILVSRTRKRTVAFSSSTNFRSSVTSAFKNSGTYHRVASPRDIRGCGGKKGG